MNKLDICADSVRIACPLFQAEGSGVIPTSALQLQVNRIEAKKAAVLNSVWHSRMPEIANWFQCFAYGAEYSGLFYAVALWGPPIARMLNGRGWLELRRMAIAPDAPKLTASRMISIMVRDIKRNRRDVCRLISYQDTAVHTGTIYKAAGWYSDRTDRGGEWARPCRWAAPVQSGAPKVRWCLDIRPQNNAEESRTSANTQRADMPAEQVEMEL